MWAFTPTGSKVTTVDPETVKRKVVALDREERKRKEITENLFEEDEADSWQEQLLEIVKNISPAGFERLCQRLLRESGFIQVEVQQFELKHDFQGAPMRSVWPDGGRELEKKPERR